VALSARASPIALSFLRCSLGLRESGQSTLLRDFDRRADFPLRLVYPGGGHFQQLSSLGLCESEALALAFELFGEGYHSTSLPVFSSTITILSDMRSLASAAALRAETIVLQFAQAVFPTGRMVYLGVLILVSD
jgi:hypothetical protein